MWWLLRNRDFAGAKFGRQYPIAGAIVDFCCIEARLVIELDGSQHVEQQTKDAVRTKALQEAGFRVIRFWNAEVLTQRDDVLERIFLALRLEYG